MHSPLIISNIRIDLSSPQEATKFPLGLNLALRTQLVCPVNDVINFRCGTFHNLRDLSSDPVIS